MRKVRTMMRQHLFEDRLDLIRQFPNQYELWHEKSTRPVAIPRRANLDRAFWAMDWAVFEAAESEYFAEHCCDGGL